MKKFLIIMLVLLPICGMQAQPQGERPGGNHPRRDMNRDHHQSGNSEGKSIMERFPEIPNLTLEQREKVGSIISKEVEEIDKQIEKNRGVEKSMREEVSDKKKEKLHKKLEKGDEKIQNIRTKSNKKIKKILNEKQYAVFVKKRDEFKFKKAPQRPPMEDGKGRPFSGLN